MPVLACAGSNICIDYCPKLEYLALTSVNLNMNDQDMIKLGKKCQNLEQLDLLGQTGFGEKGVSKLVHDMVQCHLYSYRLLYLTNVIHTSKLLHILSLPFLFQLHGLLTNCKNMTFLDLSYTGASIETVKKIRVWCIYYILLWLQEQYGAMICLKFEL